MGAYIVPKQAESKDQFTMQPAAGLIESNPQGQLKQAEAPGIIARSLMSLKKSRPMQSAGRFIERNWPLNMFWSGYHYTPQDESNITAEALGTVRNIFTRASSFPASKYSMFYPSEWLALISNVPWHSLSPLSSLSKVPSLVWEFYEYKDPPTKMMYYYRVLDVILGSLTSLSESQKLDLMSKIKNLMIDMGPRSLIYVMPLVFEVIPDEGYGKSIKTILQAMTKNIIGSRILESGASFAIKKALGDKVKAPSGSTFDGPSVQK